MTRSADEVIHAYQEEAWQLTRIDDVAAGALVLQGLVSDIGIDWADASLQTGPHRLS